MNEHHGWRDIRYPNTILDETWELRHKAKRLHFECHLTLE